MMIARFIRKLFLRKALPPTFPLQGIPGVVPPLKMGGFRGFHISFPRNRRGFWGKYAKNTEKSGHLIDFFHGRELDDG